MTEPEEILLVAMRVASYRGVIPPGSTRGKCSVCGATILLSPTSAALEYTRVICQQCDRAGPLVPPDPLTEAQRMEIARQTGLHNDQLDILWEMAVEDEMRRRP